MKWQDRRFIIILTIVFVFILVAVDFSRRVLVGRDRTLRKFVAPSIRSAPSPLSRDRVIAEITSWVEQEVSQQAKSREIILQGVFLTGSTRRVVVSLVAADGQPSQNVKLTLGDEVDGWKVDVIEAQRIVISRGPESRELVLFKRR